MSTQDTLRDAKVYEIGYLLVSSIPPEKVGEEVSFIKGLLGNDPASILGEEAPELRKIAYQMRKKIGAVYHKFDDAYFGWVKFELTPDKIDEVKQALDARDSVLRHLILSTVKENTYLGKKAPVIVKAEDIAGKDVSSDVVAEVVEEGEKPVEAPKEA